MTELLHSVSPADPRDEIGRFPVADAAAVDASVARARRAQPAWRAAGFEERVKVLRRFRDLAAGGVKLATARHDAKGLARNKFTSPGGTPT